MASSYIFVEDIGKVRIYRRRGLKNIRITIEHDGSVRLSIPWYVSKSAGLKYLINKKRWIKEHQQGISTGWEDGQRITEDYILQIEHHTGKKAICSASSGVFLIKLPVSGGEADNQKILDKQITEFLRKECTEKIVPVLYEAAAEGGFKVKEVKIKKLKSRWGSCSQEKRIVLNLSLARLPAELSEYVIYHELAHTKHLNHGKGFWQEVEKWIPDYKNRRKSLRQFNPSASH